MNLTTQLTGPQRTLIRRAIRWYMLLKDEKIMPQIYMAEAVEELIKAEPAWLENLNSKQVQYK